MYDKLRPANNEHLNKPRFTWNSWLTEIINCAGPEYFITKEYFLIETFWLPVSHYILLDSQRCNLTHRGRVTHTCVDNLTIIGSDNGLSPGWRQAIVWTNAGILLIGTYRTNFNEILIKTHIFHLWKCIWKCCLGLNVVFKWTNSNALI